RGGGEFPFLGDIAIAARIALEESEEILAGHVPQPLRDVLVAAAVAAVPLEEPSQAGRVERDARRVVLGAFHAGGQSESLSAQRDAIGMQVGLVGTENQLHAAIVP